MRNRLLVVDGEPRGLRVLDVSLRGAGFEVETASDGLQAWTLLEKTLPDLVVCDADLAGLDGYGLCARLRRTAAGAALPFLMTSASKSRDQKIRALEAGADDFLPKPAYIKEVIARIRALLHRRDREALLTGRVASSESAPGTPARTGLPPFSGDLADISVVDLVQLIEGNGRSGIVHLRRSSGAPAFLYFRGGKVIDAEAGRLSGLDALSRLFSWTAGTFEIEWKNIRRRDAIERAPSDLVLEGMQRLDAWNELRGQLGDPNVTFEVDYRLLAERLAEIPDEVNGILRLCDGARTVMQVVEESTMPDTEALTALLRLRAEGIVRDKVSDAPRPAPRPAERPGGLSSPVDAGAAEPSPRWGAVPGPGQSFAGQGEGTAPAPPPDAPRRTSPGLGQRAPGQGPPAGAVPAARASHAFQQDNVIPFPTPGPSVERTVPLTTPSPPNPTRVGFEPATLASAPAAEAETMTLALDRTEEGGLAREQLLRALDSAHGLDNSGGAAIPTESVSMSDTQRGTGSPAPTPPNEASEAYATAVPVEIPASPSRASKRSGRVSGPHNAGAPERSGRVRASTDAPVAASGVVANETSAPAPAAGPGSGPRSVPRPGDATVRVSFSEGDISRGDALDELGLPSRGRGVRVLVAGLVFGVLAAVGVTRFLATRTHHDAEDENARSAGAALPVPGRTPPAPRRPAEALVVPTAPAGPSGATPDVDLPGAAAVAPSVAADVKAPAAADPHGEPPAPAAALAAPAEPPAGSDAPGSGPGAARPVLPAPAVVVPSAAASPTAPPEQGQSDAAATAARQLATCRTAFAKNRLREAMAACTAAAAANPRSAEVLTMLAHTELNRGNLERANDLAVRAVAIDPNLADAYVIIGGVHQDSGENKEAKAAYRRYLELSPRGRYADELRSIVNGL